ncbi:sensor histidine kinase [Robertkochia solimangrovi]|uniref:sensor histidine kinase n=1 Tax=Robertkochia solimangrovi TaxID=2213046 RepID=UPI00117EF36C|nr:histidine kinase [Robertkochia solimangrovi]TRZ42571.1 histidine kinase [Robertkochia solimangrovi]
MVNQDVVISLVVYISTLIIIVFVFVVLYYLAFQHKRTQLMLEIAKQQQYYEELNRSQSELHRQSYKNIRSELHDNIGQLLSVANMQFKMLENEFPDTKRNRFKELSEVIRMSLSETQKLSRSIHPDDEDQLALQYLIENEVERYQRLKHLSIDYKLQGEVTELRKEHELVIFRIFQETISRSLQLTKATQFTIRVDYSEYELSLTIESNGSKIDLASSGNINSLTSLRNKAAVIGANFSVTPSENGGVYVTLRYTY